MTREQLLQHQKALKHAIECGRVIYDVWAGPTASQITRINLELLLETVNFALEHIDEK